METRIWRIQSPNTEEQEEGNKLVWAGSLEEFPDYRFGFSIDTHAGKFEYIVSSIEQGITKSESVEKGDKVTTHKDELFVQGGQTSISVERREELRKGSPVVRINSLSIKHPLDGYVWGDESRIFLRYDENTLDHVVFDLGAEGIQVGLQPFLSDRSKYCLNIFKQGEEVITDTELQSQEPCQMGELFVKASFGLNQHIFSIGRTPKRQHLFTFPEPTYGLALLTTAVSSHNPLRWQYALNEVHSLASSSRQ